MSTYRPEVTFDLPSGEDSVQAVVDEADMEVGDTRRFAVHTNHSVTEDLLDRVQETLSETTNGAVDSDAPIDLMAIEYGYARVEIRAFFPARESDIQRKASKTSDLSGDDEDGDPDTNT